MTNHELRTVLWNKYQLAAGRNLDGVAKMYKRQIENIPYYTWIFRTGWQRVKDKWERIGLPESHWAK